MGAVDVPLICFCDGKLIDENGSAKCIGGYNKVDKVPSTIGFTSFKEKIREMINLPSNGIEFKIKCLVRFDEFTKIAIDVDDDKSLQFTMVHSKFIMACIIKQFPLTTTFIASQREEDLLPLNVDVLHQAFNFSQGTSNDNHDDEVSPPEGVHIHGDVNGDDNPGDEVIILEAMPDRVDSSPLHTFSQANVNDPHERINISMGNPDDNQGNEVNTLERMHSEENVSAPILEEMLPSNVDKPPKWENEMGGDIPRIICDYIVYCEKVKGDGHCGYRSIAKLQGYDDETGWMRVRKELLHELQANMEKYLLQFHKSGVEQYVKNLQCTTKTTLNKNEWFDLPDMGWLTANTYNCAFVVVHKNFSLTYLPLWTSPPPDTCPIMEIAHVWNDSHFVPIRFESTSPLPPEAPGYFNSYEDNSIGWFKRFENRIALWKPLIETKINAHHEGIYKSMGNPDDNQGNEVNTSKHMHSEENVPAPILEEKFPSNVAVHLQDSNCSMLGSSHHYAQVSSDIDFAMGMEFPNIDAFRNTLSDLAVKTGCKYQPVRKTKSKLTMKCRGAGCNWRIQVTQLRNLPTFKVAKYQNKHTCSRDLQGGGGDGDHCQATIKWIVSKMQSNIEDNPDIKPSKIVNKMKKRFGIRISYNKAVKAKAKALEGINNRFKESYTLLPRLIKELERGGCVTKLGCDVDDTFQYLFWAFPACIHALRTCMRPALFVYSIPITLGVLLYACGLDGDYELIHVAFAVVVAEDEMAWESFLGYLKEFIVPDIFLVLPCHVPFTIFTHYNTAATCAVENVFPNAQHCFFYRGLVETFSGKFRDPGLREHFWVAHVAVHRKDCEDAMQEIKRINENAYDWLVTSIGLNRWAPTFSNSPLMGLFWEAYEYRPLGVRLKLPIVDFVLGTRDMVAHNFSARQNYGAKITTSLTPSFMEGIEIARRDLQHGTPFKHGRVVDLEKRSCSCGEFQLKGFPCWHADEIIVREDLDVTKHYPTWCTAETYRATYAQQIPPIAHISLWQPVDNPVRPPKRKVGRPRKIRRCVRGSSDDDCGSSDDDYI